MLSTRATHLGQPANATRCSTRLDLTISDDCVLAAPHAVHRAFQLHEALGWYRRALDNELRHHSESTATTAPPSLSPPPLSSPSHAVPVTTTETGLARDLLGNIGTVLMQLGHASAAIDAFRRSVPMVDLGRPLPVTATLPAIQARAMLLADVWRAKKVVCDWSSFYAASRELRRVVLAFVDALGTGSVGRNTDDPPPLPLLPFDTLLMPVDAAFQLLAAQHYAERFARRANRRLATAAAVDTTSATPDANMAQPWAATAGVGGNTSSGVVDRRLRIAYVSHDFTDHPTAHLMEGLFVHHDPALVDVHVFGYGRNDGSTFRRAIEDLSNKRLGGFHDVVGLDHETALSELVGAAPAVCFDAQVHTMGHRAELLASRPCALQVNFLVYPGTSGAPWLDYIVVDAAVVPPDTDAQFFSEKLVVLPDSYQANYYPRQVLSGASQGGAVPANEPIGCASFVNDDDSSGAVSHHDDCHPHARNGTLQFDGDGDDQRLRHHHRRHHGGDRETFTFCNFNKVDKLDPASFGLWARILARTPHSVLWLLKPGADGAVEAARHNMAAEAAAAGVAPSRIAWANRVAKAAHLHRQADCDLFLDSVVYNAHSTCTDALFAELPVLSLRLGTFASRVASSLVLAAGVPSLAVHSLKEFEDTAVALARPLCSRTVTSTSGGGGDNRVVPRACVHHVDFVRDQLRQGIGGGGRQSLLFDTAAYTANLERAAAAMWEVRRLRSSSLMHIVVHSQRCGAAALATPSSVTVTAAPPPAPSSVSGSSGRSHVAAAQHPRRVHSSELWDDLLLSRTAAAAAARFGGRSRAVDDASAAPHRAQAEQPFARHHGRPDTHRIPSSAVAAAVAPNGARSPLTVPPPDTSARWDEDRVRRIFHVTQGDAAADEQRVLVVARHLATAAY
jgi:predicted O-linked N-acetylglucosamine transferase (SPINDLY family)